MPLPQTGHRLLFRCELAPQQMHQTGFLPVNPYNHPQESKMRCSSIDTAAFLLIASLTQVDQTCGALRVGGGKAICALPEGDLSECGQPWGPLFSTACTCLGGQSHADRWQMVGGEGVRRVLRSGPHAGVLRRCHLAQAADSTSGVRSTGASWTGSDPHASRGPRFDAQDGGAGWGS